MFNSLPQIPSVIQNILNQSGGILLYQEQVMQILKEYAGFNDIETDVARSAMGKKNAEKMASLKIQFVEGASLKGYNNTEALKVWQELEHYAEYLFNRSHSVAYSLITYQSAYLKTHYPLHFYAALINTRLDSAEQRTETIIRTLAEAKKSNISIVYPDINISGYHCKVVNNELILGLGCVKGLGEKFITILIEERKNGGRFQNNLTKLCDRLWKPRIQADKIKLLVESGSLDSFGFTKKAMSDLVDLIAENRIKLRNKLKLKKEANRPDQQYYDDMYASEVISTTNEYSIEELLRLEKEAYGFNIQNSLLALAQDNVDENYQVSLEDLDFEELEDKASVHLLLSLVVKKIITTKRKETMAFLLGEDIAGREIEVTAFPSTWRKIGNTITSSPKALVALCVKDKSRNSLIINDCLFLKEKVLEPKSDPESTTQTS